MTKIQPNPSPKPDSVQRLAHSFISHIGCAVEYCVPNVPGVFKGTVARVNDCHVFVDFDDPRYGNNIMVTPRTLKLKCNCRKS